MSFYPCCSSAYVCDHVSADLVAAKYMQRKMFDDLVPQYPASHPARDTALLTLSSNVARLEIRRLRPNACVEPVQTELLDVVGMRQSAGKIGKISLVMHPIRVGPGPGSFICIERPPAKAVSIMTISDQKKSLLTSLIVQLAWQPSSSTMRLLCHLPMAFTVFLSETSGETTTDGDQVNVTALVSSTVPARPNESAFVSLKRVEPHNSTVGNTSLEDQRKEERAIIPSTVYDAIDKLWEGFWGTMRSQTPIFIDNFAARVAGENLINEGTITDMKKFQQVLCDLFETHNVRGKHRRVVDYLTQSVLRNGREHPRVEFEDLTKLFHEFRQSTGMQVHADRMQRIVALLYPDESLDLMMEHWVTSELTPDQVYGILPAGLEEKLVFSRPFKLPILVCTEAYRMMDHYIALYSYRVGRYAIDQEKSLLEFYLDYFEHRKEIEQRFRRRMRKFDPWLTLSGAWPD